MSLRRRLLHVVAASALALLAASGLLAKDEAGLPELRRTLLEAREERAVLHALDRIQERVGQVPELKDVGAFGDWLGALPDGRDAHPAVLARRGWAYVAARRGAEAVEPLERALKDDPGQGLVRAYLGEALRQAGRPTEALDMLATARRAGQDTAHVRDSALQALLGLRKAVPAQDAQGLPAYVKGCGAYLAAGPDPRVDAVLARALLDDLAAYERAASERGATWARAAAEHAHRALGLDPSLEGGARLALDAARGLDREDEATGGATLRFDLLARAYALGKPSDREGHDLPQVLPLLAEACLREGRYELAARLARERLDLSESPAARRVLLRLPPDLGD